ncbi:MAG TPA: ATP-binding protein [Streptosporangiaceae bacterium]
MTSTPVFGDEKSGPWFRVLSITEGWGASSAEGDFLAVLPAAASAARCGRPLVTGWLYRGAGAPLELITNAVLPGACGGAGSCSLLFPAGARGAAAPPGWLAAWEELTWAPCPGRQAPPLLAGRDDGAIGETRQPTRFEAALAALMPAPFGWLVVAEPTGLLEAELAELRSQVNVLRQHDEERARFGAQRAARRLAELDAFREAGLWDVRVLAGAATPEELARIAPVLAGSVELGHHPYRLASSQSAQPLPGALRAAMSDLRSEARVPFTATAGVLAALAGLPRCEVPGLRVLDAGQFDLTSETTAANGLTATGAAQPAQAVSLGAVLDGQDRAAGEFLVPLATLNRHTFVTGATGAGKSQTVRHLLERLAGAGIPWLAIEPVKSEYAAIAGRLPGPAAVTVVNPADPAAIPLSVNPLAPEPGYPVQAHIDMVRALFLAAFDADEPFPQIISQALQRVYEANGWDVVTGGRLPGAHADPLVPTLAQLQRAALEVIADVGYGRELQADVRGFVDVRLRSLRIGSAGRFFEGGHPVDVAALLGRNVVLAIEDIANDEDKAFAMGTLIVRIVEHLRLRSRAGLPTGLRHVIVIEEAHRLLRARPPGRAGAHAVELFAGLLAEIRAYGEGLVVAEQIPSKLLPDVVKNTALKVVHRLPAADDRGLVGAAMNLAAQQSRQVVSLPPGVAAVFADGMDRPIRVRVPFGGDRERALPGPPPPALRPRSPACGPRCQDERACTLREIRHADLLAGPAAGEDAWLRVWAETVVLAFLTNSGLPRVPGRLRKRWDGMAPRLRECLLATLLDRAVASRERALATSYAPGRLTASAAKVALGLLSRPGHLATRPGPTWVIPQLRWLHEMERVWPAGHGAPGQHEYAPPLDFDLPGLMDWPGMRVGHRLRALRRHRLSMELAHNRMHAWTALVGEDDQHAFGRDLAMIGVGLAPAARLHTASSLMGVESWLETVLSWPRRFIASPWQ